MNNKTIKKKQQMKGQRKCGTYTNGKLFRHTKELKSSHFMDKPGRYCHPK
jgi:hypothetical protein